MKKIFCSIFGHHFTVSKKVTAHIREYSCVHCGHQMTTDLDGNYDDLTEKRQEINATLAQMYQRRTATLQNN